MVAQVIDFIDAISRVFRPFYPLAQAGYCIDIAAFYTSARILLKLHGSLKDRPVQG